MSTLTPYPSRLDVTSNVRAKNDDHALLQDSLIFEFLSTQMLRNLRSLHMKNIARMAANHNLAMMPLLFWVGIAKQHGE